MAKLSTENKAGYQPVRAPRGTEISCKGWQQEAALRMLMNNLDPEVAEKPEELIVYGGTGKAARNWACFEAIVASLRGLENDETLLVQSGKPVGIFHTHEYAPRVLIANANLVGHWSNWAQFGELERAGLMMYGQMTAGSWIYIGTQGILQGTYETFAAAARKHFAGDLSGKLVVSGGMGGMGGAQPLAATMNGGAFLGIDVDPERIKRRVKTGYCDVMVNDLDEALRILKNAVRKREAASVGLVGNCADVVPALARRGVVPDLLTDQTSAHDPLNGYVPNGMTLEQALELRRAKPEEYQKRSLEAIAAHVRGMLELQKLGAVTFDYGNNIRTFAFQQGVKDAYDFPGFVPAYIRPLFCEGRGPFRWAALSGEASDIHRTDELVLEMFPHDEILGRWIRLAQKRVRFQGLPARICWLGYGERDKFGLALNDLVARGELGFHPQWRWRGDRVLATFGTSDRRRWYPGDGRAHRTRIDQRPGDRRRAPRGRGLPGSDGVCEKERSEDSDGLKGPGSTHMHWKLQQLTWRFYVIALALFILHTVGYAIWQGSFASLREFLDPSIVFKLEEYYRSKTSLVFSWSALLTLSLYVYWRRKRPKERGDLCLLILMMAVGVGSWLWQLLRGGS